MHALSWGPTAVSVAQAVKAALHSCSHLERTLCPGTTGYTPLLSKLRFICCKYSALQHYNSTLFWRFASMHSNQQLNGFRINCSSDTQYLLQRGGRSMQHCRSVVAPALLAQLWASSTCKSSRYSSSRPSHPDSLSRFHCDQVSIASLCSGQLAISIQLRGCTSSSSSSSRGAVVAAAARSAGRRSSTDNSSSSNSNCSSNSRRSSSSSSAGTGNNDWCITDEDEAQFWRDAVQQLQTAEAAQGAALVDLNFRMGISPDVSQSKDTKKPAGWQWIISSKQQHPTAIALVHIGDSYVAAGIDAVLLVEHCGTSYVGGVPKQILQATIPEETLELSLQKLVEQAGLSVAVWEPVEAGTESAAARGAYTCHLLTPEMLVPKLFGVCSTVSGLSVFRLNRSALTIETFNGLSDDAFWGILKSDRSANPVVYIYRPIDTAKPASTAMAADAELMRAVLRNTVAAVRQNLAEDKNVVVREMRGAPDKGPLDTFMATVRKALGLPRDAELHVKPAMDMRYYPGVQPLYLTTQQQLGLEPFRGVPSLVDFLLPDHSPAAAHKLLASMLSAPPPHTVADATRKAVRALLALDEVMYRTAGSISPTKVTRTFAGGPAPAAFFQDLHSAIEPVVLSMSASHSPAVAAVVDASWPLLLHTMGADSAELTQQSVLSAAQQTLYEIQRLIAGVVEPAEDPTDVQAETVAQPEGLPSDAAEVLVSLQVLEALDELADGFELCREQVQRAAIPEQWDQVAAATQRLRTALEIIDRFWNMKELSWQSLNLQSRRARLEVDPENTAISFRFVNRTIADQTAAFKIKYPVPFYGNMVPEADLLPKAPSYMPTKEQGLLRTCTLLENCLQEYRDAVAAANEATERALADLTRKLAPCSTELAAAVQFGVVLTALADHAKAAQQSGWTVPYVGVHEQQQQQQQQQLLLTDGSSSNNGLRSSSGSSSNSSQSKLGQFHLMNLWPYWMERDDDNTVKNDVQLDGFMLLTGPNMAGKSTVLRSVAAAALCGCSGLAVPAAAGSMLPHLDAVVLRTFSGDAPIEGLSAFGVEMREMGYVLDEVKPGSLVLIDELGKGTEVVTGSAMAGAMLEHLAEAGARGMFATHLHLLLKTPLDTSYVVNYRMEVEQNPESNSGSDSDSDSDATNPSLQPTLRLLPGSCTESLAFEVAREQEIPEDVIKLAAQEYEALVAMGGEAALIAIAADGGSRWNGPGSANASSSSSSGSPDDVMPVAATSAAAAGTDSSGVGSSSWSVAGPAGSNSSVDDITDSELGAFVTQQQADHAVDAQQQPDAGLGKRRRPGRSRRRQPLRSSFSINITTVCG